MRFYLYSTEENPDIYKVSQKYLQTVFRKKKRRQKTCGVGSLNLKEENLSRVKRIVLTMVKSA